MEADRQTDSQTETEAEADIDRQTIETQADSQRGSR